MFIIQFDILPEIESSLSQLPCMHMGISGHVNSPIIPVYVMVSVSQMAKVLKGLSNVVTIEEIGGSSANLIHTFISFPSDVEFYGLSNLHKA